VVQPYGAEAMADSENVAAELALGSLFTGCRVEGVIGRGEMGVVYRAEELALQRMVALKLIRPEHSQDARFRERFRRESRLAASIDHPNVIPILEAGDEDDVLFIMMRLVEGTDLRALIAAQGPLEPLRAARIVNQVGAALDAAHARGLVHRDVKPANVLLARRDHVYLTDFGLAKRADSGGELTRAGSIVARAEYVAPEQITNQRVDARADVYALGCLLFEALTGEAPFARGKGVPALAHLGAPPPSAVERRPDLPREFDEVVRRAMAQRPSERYPSAGDLGQGALVAAGALRRARRESVVATGEAALQAVGTGLPAPSRSDESAEPVADARADRARRRSRMLLRGVAVGFLAILAVGVVAALGALADLGPDPVARTPLKVGAAPGALAVGGGALWVANAADGTVSRIGPASRKVTGAPIRVGPAPAALAVGAGAVWVANSDDDTVSRIDPASGTVVGRPIDVGAQPLGVATGRGAVWVVNSADDTVSRIDPISGRVVGRPIDVGDQPLGVAADRHAVWVVNGRGDSLTRIGSRTTRADRTISLHFAPTAVAIGEGAVWVVSADRGTLTPVTPGARRVLGRAIRVGTSPVAVAVGDGAVWVADAAEGAVKKINPRTRAVVATTRVGRWPSGIAVAHGAIWASNSIDGTVTPIDP
jgi:DNA-binding beta-propeller fold protein YncE/tRNA A-37 threonylcarbamoyl transferase component Bud32